LLLINLTSHPLQFKFAGFVPVNKEQAEEFFQLNLKLVAIVEGLQVSTQTCNNAFAVVRSAINNSTQFAAYST
jgi:hypothetical protein